MFSHFSRKKAGRTHGYSEYMYLKLSCEPFLILISLNCMRIVNSISNICKTKNKYLRYKLVFIVLQNILHENQCIFTFSKRFDWGNFKTCVFMYQPLLWVSGIVDHVICGWCVEIKVIGCQIKAVRRITHQFDVLVG